ncbi:hypothetical protein [Aestuariivivens sediminis]|uniref:hypothetical protein n=1 Tax=Aestuariivivens sediminis TaxID=2913557 RepID=UPI001F59741C|nr:hypothetical protein [Aestuariivivens sediminis]
MKYLNYLFISIGALVAIYAKAGEDQNEVVLIGGIVVLMIGVYRLTKRIPGKRDKAMDDREKEAEDCN